MANVVKNFLATHGQRTTEEACRLFPGAEVHLPAMMPVAFPDFI